MSNTNTITQVTLTDEQSNAVDAVSKFFLSPSKNTDDFEYKLGGYAGTGKTTVIKSILEQLQDKHRITVTAFTGKACNVLNKKQVPAQTLHSLMYEVIEEGHEISFVKRTSLDGRPDFIIVDESSMISTELYNDLMSFGKRVLFVGDPGQLEPVGDNPNLMREPNLVLSKIHRQAAQSPIITLANDIRIGKTLPFTQTSDELTIRLKNYTTNDLINNVSQVIVAKNKTRQTLNNAIRAAKNYPLNSITLNEKIIILRNNQSFGVFNGMILFIKNINHDYADYWSCDCEDEIGKLYRGLKLFKPPLTNPLFDIKTQKIPRDRVYFDYGYVITCHKSQGSEWEHVFVVDEWMPPQVWDMKRWRYTAITRAAKRLTYAK